MPRSLPPAQRLVSRSPRRPARRNELRRGTERPSRSASISGLRSDRLGDRRAKRGRSRGAQRAEPRDCGDVGRTARRDTAIEAACHLRQDRGPRARRPRRRADSLERDEHVPIRSRRRRALARRRAQQRARVARRATQRRTFSASLSASGASRRPRRSRSPTSPAFSSTWKGTSFVARDGGCSYERLVRRSRSSRRGRLPARRGVRAGTRQAGRHGANVTPRLGRGQLDGGASTAC